jgi:hypothetical protein
MMTTCWACCWGLKRRRASAGRPGARLPLFAATPEALSPPALFVPGGQDVQAFEDTYSFAPQSVASHFVLVIVSALHDDVPGTVYPGFQVGWHVDPLAKKLLQSPTPP